MKIETLNISKKTRMGLPSLPFSSMKDEILGKDYVLSVAYVDEKTSYTINKTYRGKDKPTNVLSFPISEKTGELVLCPSLIKKESADEEKNFGKNFRDLLGYLVIHGMLHLKGMDHGAIMDRLERKYDTKYFSGNRRGLRRHTGSSRRIR